MILHTFQKKQTIMKKLLRKLQKAMLQGYAEYIAGTNLAYDFLSITYIRI